jgi:hypothetical protein
VAFWGFLIAVGWERGAWVTTVQVNSSTYVASPKHNPPFHGCHNRISLSRLS